MKKLIALISTHGKTTKQLTSEVWEAFKSFKKLEAKVKKQMQKN